jgi:hypothetical protein
MSSQGSSSDGQPNLIVERATAVSQGSKPILAKLISASIPLYREVGRNYTPELFGTGFAIHIGRRKMLVTARHVAEFLFDDVKKRFFVPHKGELRPFDCFISRWGRSGVSQNQDDIDLAVIDLDDAQVEQLEEHRFIQLEEMEFSTFVHNPASYYVFMGYPERRNEGKYKVDEVNTELVPYFGPPISLEEHNKLDRPLNTHLAINWNKKKARNLDGTSWTPPNPEGISGCPVWAIGTEPEIVLGSKKPLLAGMGIENRSRALIAVRAWVILQIIRGHHPDLKAVIPEAPNVNFNLTGLIQREQLVLGRP